MHSQAADSVTENEIMQKQIDHEHRPNDSGKLLTPHVITQES